jgi:hypothetical protein
LEAEFQHDYETSLKSANKRVDAFVIKSAEWSRGEGVGAEIGHLSLDEALRC